MKVGSGYDPFAVFSKRYADIKGFGLNQKELKDPSKIKAEDLDVRFAIDGDALESSMKRMEEEKQIVETEKANVMSDLDRYNQRTGGGMDLFGFARNVRTRVGARGPKKTYGVARQTLLGA